MILWVHGSTHPEMTDGGDPNKVSFWPYSAFSCEIRRGQLSVLKRSSYIVGLGSDPLLRLDTSVNYSHTTGKSVTDKPIIRDEVARRNLELTIEAVEKGEYGEVWLHLNVEEFAAFRNGLTDTLPSGFWAFQPAHKMMLADIRGMEVLCLAGGGGQQSALCSLLGAKVTVLDLTPEQLRRDQVAAQHYGYEVETIQGDMRDLSVLEGRTFDRVIQPISTLYVPDLSELFAGVARVLKSGGLYYADFCYPRLYMVEDLGWDGNGYLLRFSQPHKRGAVLETEPDGLMNFTEGVSYGEFNHLLSDIVNGLISEGLMVKGIWDDDPLAKDFNELEPGSDEHRDAILPMGMTVVAEKAG